MLAVAVRTIPKLGRYSSVQEGETKHIWAISDPNMISEPPISESKLWFQEYSWCKDLCKKHESCIANLLHSYWQLAVQPVLQFSWEEWLISAQAQVLWTEDFQPLWPGLAPHTALWQSISSLKFWSHGWSHIQDDKSLPCRVELLHSEGFLLAPVREAALTCPKILVKAKASFFWRILHWWRWMKA